MTSGASRAIATAAAACTRAARRATPGTRTGSPSRSGSPRSRPRAFSADGRARTQWPGHEYDLLARNCNHGATLCEPRRASCRRRVAGEPLRGTRRRAVAAVTYARDQTNKAIADISSAASAAWESLTGGATSNDYGASAAANGEGGSAGGAHARVARPRRRHHAGVDRRRATPRLRMRRGPRSSAARDSPSDWMYSTYLYFFTQEGIPAPSVVECEERTTIGGDVVPESFVDR